jgi:F0F1-type ATP synthase assembly protein I
LGKGSLVELRERQATWDGFGNGLSQAVEMVVTPLLFALFGWFLDTRFGTGPVLAIVFGVIGVAGMAARTYYWYRAAIEREEEGKPWTRRRK